MTPPLTAPNMAPKFKRDTNKENRFLSPKNSEGKQLVVED
jgi:hypothetical protein